MKVRTADELVYVMQLPTEAENVEFKEAKSRYDFDELTKYCCALANEGGGVIILGITDKPPRRVVGTKAFDPIDPHKLRLFDRLRWRVDAVEIFLDGQRALAFNVPGRPSGHPIHYDGRYWMRVGSNLLPMSAERIKEIVLEIGSDFSADICSNANLSDIDTTLVDVFRRLWARKAQDPAISAWSDLEVLDNAELVVDGNITNAALILMGSKRSVTRHLPQSETIYEYRSSDSEIEYKQRIEFRSGFFDWYDEIWRSVNSRNDVQQFRQGLLRFDIPIFGEDSVREAILNAICHRSYQDGASIWVRQFPRSLEVISPGGFLPGITPDNVLTKQKPRNRRIAETLAKGGFIERSGQGVDRMFRQSIEQSKPLPDFSNSDQYSVDLRLNGEVRDPKFVEFMDRIGRDTGHKLTTQDFLVVNMIHNDEKVPTALYGRIKVLEESGVLEKSGRRSFILSRRFYAHLGKTGIYTRRRGLEQPAEKALLYQHIDSGDGVPISELLQILPARDRNYIKRLLNELKEEGRIHVQGRTRAGKWHVGRELHQVGS